MIAISVSQQIFVPMNKKLGGILTVIYTSVTFVSVDQIVVKHTMKCLELRKHMFCPPEWLIVSQCRNADDQH